MNRMNRGIAGATFALAAVLVVAVLGLLGCSEMALLQEVRSRVPSANGNGEEEPEEEEEDLGIAQLSLPSGVETDFYANRLGLQYQGEMGVGSFLTTAWIVNDAFPLETMFSNDDLTGTIDSIMTLYIEFEDASNSVDIDPGSYSVGQTGTGGAYQVMLFVNASFDGTSDGPSSAEYCAMFDTNYFDNDSVSIDPISGGTVNVARSGDDYTFTLDVALESGEKVTGTVTSAPDLIDDTTTFTLEVYGASGLDEDLLMYGVFEEGAVVEPGDPDNLALAAGEAVFSGGKAEALAEESDGVAWQGKIGRNYDVYPIIDTDGNGQYDGGVDCAYDPMPLDVTLHDSWGEYWSVSISDFSCP